jgi:hypothetical protein
MRFFVTKPFRWCVPQAFTTFHKIWYHWFVVILPLTLQRGTTYKDVAQLAVLKIKIVSKNMLGKPKKTTKYSFSLLIMYGSFYMFRHYIAIFRERS